MKITLKIDETLKDRDITQANTKTLQRAHKFTIKSGVSIQSDIIALWPKSVLQEIIKTKQDITLSQKPRKRKAAS